MDYSYYNTAQTPYQFVGYQEFDVTQQESNPNGFPSTISPMTQNFDASFDPFPQNVYDTEGFILPPLGQHRRPLHSLQRSPASSVSPSNSLRKARHKVSSSELKAKSNIEQLSHNNGSENINDDLISRTRSSSEEKDSLTPVQSKRKAQNRAAQRAFRERKERHVKELEEKLNEMEAQSASLHSENERLKGELAKFATDNEILRATSSSASKHQLPAKREDEIMKAGPMKYTPTDFLSAIDRSSPTDSSTQQSQNESNQDGSTSPSSASSQLPKSNHIPAIESQLSPNTGSFLPSAHRISASPVTGQRLLSAGYTWDYILAHSLYRRGMVDIADVSERLKGKAECDGSGPAFGEAVVRRAIEEAAGTSVSMPGRWDGEEGKGEDVVMSSPE